MRIKSARDAVAGALFVLFGGVALVASHNAKLGSASQMGPGYLPFCLGIVLGVLGLVTIATSISRTDDQRASDESIGATFAPDTVRPMFLIPFSVIAFGLLIERAGLASAVAAATFLSALAAYKFSLKETAITVAVLMIVVPIVFVYLLEVPVKILPWALL